MSAPDHLELYANRTSARNRSLTVLPSARLVSANPALALSTIKASDDPTQEDAVSALASLLQPILPYLTYPALLYLASESSGLSSLLFPGTAADQAAHLSTLIDFQRDWVGSAACETRFQDDFLVDVFGPGGGAAWGAMRADCAFKLVSRPARSSSSRESRTKERPARATKNSRRRSTRRLEDCSRMVGGLAPEARTC